MSQQHIPVINHDCCSDESLCIEKKLWYELGNLKSERLARIARDNGLKLTAICPGLITGREFSSRNPTATTAYLQGRYICFNQVIKTADDATRLAVESSIPERAIIHHNNLSIEPSLELSNRKLASLLSRSRRHCYEDY